MRGMWLTSRNLGRGLARASVATRKPFTTISWSLRRRVHRRPASRRAADSERVDHARNFADLRTRRVVLICGPILCFNGYAVGCEPLAKPRQAARSRHVNARAPWFNELRLNPDNRPRPESFHPTQEGSEPSRRGVPNGAGNFAEVGADRRFAIWRPP